MKRYSPSEAREAAKHASHLPVALYSNEAANVISAVIAKADEIFDCRSSKYWKMSYRGERRSHTEPVRPALCRYWTAAVKNNDGQVVVATKRLAPHAMKISSLIAYAIKDQLTEAKLWGKTQSERATVSEDLTAFAGTDNAYNVKTAALMFELFLGRDITKIKELFGEDFVKKVIGKPDSTLVVERRKVIEAEIARLATARDTETTQVRHEFDEMWRELSKKREAKISEIVNGYTRQIAELTCTLDIL